jgi:hypothetical protein
MTHDYAKGQFQSYRAITKIHLGAISDNLSEGEEIQYDGHVLRRGNDEHSLHSLRAAIKVGWLVPVAAPPTQYVPKPAGVTVHRANGTDDSEINLNTVFETDVNVGTLDEVRPDAAPRTHRAIAAGQENTGEGRIVGKIKTSAKSDTVQIGRDDRKVVATLDNKDGIDVERVAIATGDVQEARGGDDLVDLLPDAATAGIPKPGPSGEGSGDRSEDRARAFTATGSSVIGGADDGRVVGRVGTPQTTEGLEFIQQFIPGFEWDPEVQWAKRVKIACEKYGGIPAVLDYIKSVETDTVRKHIDKRLAEAKR